HGDVRYLDVGVGEEVVGVDVDARDAVEPGDFAGVLGVARGDGDGVESGLSVGDEVTVAHDEAGPDAADAEVLAAGQARQVVEREAHGDSGSRIENQGEVGQEASGVSFAGTELD